MRNRTIIFGSIGLLVALVMVTGCGDENDSAPATGGQPTTAAEEAAGDGNSSSGNRADGTVESSKAEFIARANDVCAATKAEIDAKLLPILQANADGDWQDAEFEKMVDEVVAPGFEKQIRDLRALGAEQGASENVEVVATAIEEAVEQARQDPAAFAVEEKRPFVKPEELARKAGFAACGRP